MKRKNEKKKKERGEGESKSGKVEDSEKIMKRENGKKRREG